MNSYYLYKAQTDLSGQIDSIEEDVIRINIPHKLRLLSVTEKTQILKRINNLLFNIYTAHENYLLTQEWLWEHYSSIKLYIITLVKIGLGVNKYNLSSTVFKLWDLLKKYRSEFRHFDEKYTSAYKSTLTTEIMNSI